MIRHFRNTSLLTVAAITILVLGGCGTTATSASAPTTSAASPSGSPDSAPATTQAPTTPTTPAAPATTQAPTTPAAPTKTPGIPAGYVPLYPFASLADVRAWQASYKSGGHQPWHLSADVTATAFAAFLGYTDVTQVAHSTVSGGDAHITVGIKYPDGNIGPAAIIHLLRFGSGSNAPWEVVGTDDTTFTLDHPAYGAAVPSSVTVGGKITGVDENIRVTVHSLSAQGPIGSYCCEPAGGSGSPWTAHVTFHAAPGTVVTIAVSTGGHVAGVERFAVTGAYASLEIARSAPSGSGFPCGGAVHLEYLAGGLTCVGPPAPGASHARLYQTAQGRLRVSGQISQRIKKWLNPRSFATATLG